MVYTKLRISPEEWEAQKLLNFLDTSGWSNLGQSIRRYNNHQQKTRKTSRIMVFAVPVDHRVKSNAKRGISTSTLLGNWKSWIIRNYFVLGALGTVTEGLVQGLDDLEITGWLERFQSAELLWLARILRRVLEILGDLLSFKIQWMTITNTDVKNSQGVK